MMINRYINPFLHADISNVYTPYLVGMCDGQVPQQVWFDKLRVISLAEIGLGIYCIDAHVAHNATCTLPIDQNVIVTAQMRVMVL